MKKNLLLLLLTIFLTVSCVKPTDPEPMSFSINQGWKYLKGENPDVDNAKKHFDAVIKSKEALTEEKDVARVGLGWVHVKKDDLENSIYYFKLVDKVSNDRNIGLASAYLARGRYTNNDNDYYAASTLLKEVGIDSIKDVSNFNSRMGISLPEAKALLAISYINTGALTLARAMINEAYQLDINKENTIVKQVKESFDELEIY